MVGDLSGKYGKLPITKNADGTSSVTAKIEDRMLPSLSNMAGRGLTVKCGSHLWCTTLQRM